MMSSVTDIPNLAPEIFRQRLLVEGYFTKIIDEPTIRRFMLDVAAHLDLRTYGEPIIFAPETGMGSGENAGYDAFVPLIDSGISAYFWTGPKFLSIVFYTCKGFDAAAAQEFTSDFFAVEGEMAIHVF